MLKRWKDEEIKISFISFHFFSFSFFLSSLLSIIREFVVVKAGEEERMMTGKTGGRPGVGKENRSRFRENEKSFRENIIAMRWNGNNGKMMKGWKGVIKCKNLIVPIFNAL